MPDDISHYFGDDCNPPHTLPEQAETLPAEVRCAKVLRAWTPPDGLVVCNIERQEHRGVLHGFKEFNDE